MFINPLARLLSPAMFGYGEGFPQQFDSGADGPPEFTPEEMQARLEKARSMGWNPDDPYRGQNQDLVPAAAAPRIDPQMAQQYDAQHDYPTNLASWYQANALPGDVSQQQAAPPPATAGMPEDRFDPQILRNTEMRLAGAKRQLGRNLMARAGQAGVSAPAFGDTMRIPSGILPAAALGGGMVGNEPLDDVIARQNLGNRLAVDPQGDRWAKMLAADKAGADGMMSVADEPYDIGNAPDPQAILAKIAADKAAGRNQTRLPQLSERGKALAMQREAATRERVNAAKEGRARWNQSQMQGAGGGGSAVGQLWQLYQSGQLNAPPEVLADLYAKAQATDAQREHNRMQMQMQGSELGLRAREGDLNRKMEGRKLDITEKGLDYGKADTRMAWTALEQRMRDEGRTEAEIAAARNSVFGGEMAPQQGGPPPAPPAPGITPAPAQQQPTTSMGPGNILRRMKAKSEGRPVDPGMALTALSQNGSMENMTELQQQQLQMALAEAGLTPEILAQYANENLMGPQLRGWAKPLNWLGGMGIPDSTMNEMRAQSPVQKYFLQNNGVVDPLWRKKRELARRLGAVIPQSP